MNIPTVGSSAISALKYLAQYASQSTPPLDPDGDRDRSNPVDLVQFSPQAKLLAAQQQGDQSLWILLAQALQSGDLSGAQTAFSNLQQRFQQKAGGTGATTSATGASQANPISQDLNALGQALQAGDVTAAQDAFAKLQQDFQQLQGKHHHHHHRPGNSGPSGTTIDIQALVLNISAAGGGTDSTASGQAAGKA